MGESLQKINNILIADDHKLVAKLIYSYLVNFVNMNLVGSASSGEEVIEIARANRVDLVLMDIVMPGMNGLVTAKALYEIDPKIKIIFLSGLNNKNIIHEAIKIGADGFLTKNASIEEIIEGIQTVLRGDKYFSKECMNVYVKEQEAETAVFGGGQISEILTEREKEIMEMVVAEMNVNEIADKLCLSPRTVETHKRNIMTKLGVKSTVALVKMFYETKILQLNVKSKLTSELN